jgi:hypothetical protein
MAAHHEKPELTVRRHLAMTLAAAHPQILDAVRGGE